MRSLWRPTGRCIPDGPAGILAKNLLRSVIPWGVSGAFGADPDQGCAGSSHHHSAEGDSQPKRYLRAVDASCDDQLEHRRQRAGDGHQYADLICGHPLGEQEDIGEGDDQTAEYEDWIAEYRAVSAS